MAGNFDPNKDYAAAIKNESDPGKKQQLISERQNKIDAMNAAGTNKNNYSNDIYNGGGNNSSGNKGFIIKIKASVPVIFFEIIGIEYHYYSKSQT